MTRTDPRATVAGESEGLASEVYDELRRLARSYLAHERRDHTLQPTALVHEAFLRLSAQSDIRWQGRTHFLAISARMMRRLLIDHARHRGRVRRGRDWQRVTLTGAEGCLPNRDLSPADLLDLEDALLRLSQLDEREARVVELKFFAGMTTPEIAEALGVSPRTVEGDWSHAKAWLAAELRDMR
ncbi:MAG: ECF-type sigma factor [Thermoanaerobaculia bacterium]|nr:ECF-type sigma factor [Thermoanaerobaculia bacterium]